MRCGIVGMICVAMSAWAGAVRAVPISVVNSGFELDENGVTNNSDEFTALLGWSSAESGFGGQHNDFTAADDNMNGVNFSDQPQDSRQGHINVDNGPLAQELAAVFVEGVEYTLTVGVGRREDHDDLGIAAANWSISLQHGSGAIAGGGTAIDTGTTTIGGGGFFTDEGFTFTALAADAGQSIHIVLAHEGGVSGGFSAVNFENVRLSDNTIPEPSSVFLAGLGLVGLIRLVRRRC